MSNNSLPTNIPGDKIKKALTLLAQKLEVNPDADRKKLLNEVEIRFDLTPKECEFLHRNFSEIDTK